jgi:hypothetical protein
LAAGAPLISFTFTNTLKDAGIHISTDGRVAEPTEFRPDTEYD